MSVPCANTRASRNVSSTASQPLIEKPALMLTGCAGAEMDFAIPPMTTLSSCIANRISTPEHPVHLDAGFSVNGWLAVLLTFLLARVFAEGALMRDDLAGTV